MRYLLFLILITAFACSSQPERNNEIANDSSALESESTNEPVQAKNIESVEDIKLVFNQLQAQLNADEMDSVSVEYDCNGEKSGTITYYSDKNNVRVIKHSYGEYSHFSADEEYYLKDDKLFFVFVKETAWGFIEGGTQDNIEEKRIYIVKDEPIQCLNKKYAIKSTTEDNPKSNEVANAEADCASFKNLLKTFNLLKKFKGSESNCFEE